MPLEQTFEAALTLKVWKERLWAWLCRYVQVLSGTCNTEESLNKTICRSFLAAPKCHQSPSWQQIWAPQHVLKFPQQGMSTQWYYTDYTLLNHQSLETTSEGQDEHGKSFQRCSISMIWHDLANMVTSFLSTLTRDSESWMIVWKITLLSIARMDPYAVLGVEAAIQTLGGSAEELRCCQSCSLKVSASQAEIAQARTWT